MPYELKGTNYTEIFNETCVLIVGYLLFIFTDFVDSLECRGYAGYAIIAIICLNFGGIILLQVFQMFKNLKSACKRFKGSRFWIKFTKKMLSASPKSETIIIAKKAP